MLIELDYSIKIRSKDKLINKGFSFELFVKPLTFPHKRAGKKTSN